MENKKLKIRDLTLRDGQQSLFATRMKQQDIDPLLPLYKDAGFYIMEVWGGAVPDSVMRYLDESPWVRLRTISEAIGGKSLLSALSRGRNLFGYVPYPDSVLEGFYKEAIKNGLNVMRIFDALNDIDNVKESIRLINQLGGIADAAVCYTVDPKDAVENEAPKKKGFLSSLFGKKEEAPVSKKIFTDEYFVEKAVEMERLGAKIITLKDMAGLVNPLRAASIIGKLKQAVKVPVDFHTHCTPGYGLASSLMAILNGVDILDTNIWWFGEGSAAPAIELVYVFCKKLGIEVDVNRKSEKSASAWKVSVAILPISTLTKTSSPNVSTRWPMCCPPKSTICSIRLSLPPRLATRMHCSKTATQSKLTSVSQNRTSSLKTRKFRAVCTPTWWHSSRPSTRRICSTMR